MGNKSDGFVGFAKSIRLLLYKTGKNTFPLDNFKGTCYISPTCTPLCPPLKGGQSGRLNDRSAALRRNPEGLLAFLTAFIVSYPLSADAQAHGSLRDLRRFPKIAGQRHFQRQNVEIFVRISSVPPLREGAGSGILTADCPSVRESGRAIRTDNNKKGYLAWQRVICRSSF